MCFYNSKVLFLRINKNPKKRVLYCWNPLFFKKKESTVQQITQLIDYLKQYLLELSSQGLTKSNTLILYFFKKNSQRNDIYL
jgi:hypothetical protein